MRYAFALILPLLLALPAQAPAALPPCTLEQHARYQVRGPDGAMYPTWHPLIDHAQGCVNDHEHGSAPYPVAAAVPFNQPSATAAGWPAYGYTAGRMGMEEGHSGFKTVVLRAEGDVWLLVTMHQGTANAAKAACARHHTLDVQVFQGGERKADVRLMADFGRSQNNQGGMPFTPPGCPNQAQAGTMGVRVLPLAGGPGYEPWQASPQPTAFGFSAGRFTLTAHQPQTACNDLTCSANVARPDSNGVWRTVEIAAGFGFGDGPRGEFYTDAHGMVIVDASTPGAVRQWIEPGWSWALGAALLCNPYGADMLYDCTGALTNDQQYRRLPVTGSN